MHAVCKVKQKYIIIEVRKVRSFGAKMEQKSFSSKVQPRSTGVAYSTSLDPLLD